MKITTMRRFFLCTFLMNSGCTLYSNNNNLADLILASQCNYDGKPVSNIPATAVPDISAETIVDEITAYSGLRRNFIILATNETQNAAAVIMPSGERYLLYNPSFVHSIEQKTHSYWAAISIIAHEIGHHLQGHTLTKDGSRPGTELEADEYSGFVLQKMGATLEEAQLAINAVASDMASYTHPAKQARLLSVRTGWMRAAHLTTLPSKLDMPSFQTDDADAEFVQKQNSEAINRYKIFDGFVKDSKTGLIWTRCSLGQKWNGATCQGTATKYIWDDIVTRHFSFAGYNDWRLPTIAELKTLLYCSSGKPNQWNESSSPCDGDYAKPTLINKAFPNVASDAVFWSSSANEDNPSTVWVADFFTGVNRYDYRRNLFAVRLVRNDNR
jgi:hypothetical protein